MENIFNYRLVIITDDDEKNKILKSQKKGNDYTLIVEGEDNSKDYVKILKYKNDFRMHQECLEDYSKQKQYFYSNRDYIVEKGNIIFMILDRTTFIALLPSKLTDNQLYKLDYVENWMQDATAIGAYKYNEKGVITEEFGLTEEDNLGSPQKRFSEEVIQSYYQKRKVK